jgi:phosphoribosylformylglycinamidine synthase
MPEHSAGSGRPVRETDRGVGAVRALVLTGLGLNCEWETAEAFRLAGAACDQVHLLDLLEDKGSAPLARYQILAFVGGFAFGDHLGAGFVFANKIRAHLWEPLFDFLDRGGLVLGICNGFQTLVRLGVLPGFEGEDRSPCATLAPNDRLGYRDAWVRLKAEPESPCLWTRGIDSLELPARHGEGKLLAEPAIISRLEQGGQVALRYVDSSGRPTESWPDNPNGSPGGIAGICDPSGRVFGLMPHPDAYLYPFHHPQWPMQRLRGWLPAEGEGLKIFRNGVTAAREMG